MSTTRILLAAIAASMALAPGPYAGADAQRLRDQDAAFKEAQRGKIMPLPRIERAAREHPFVRGAEYLGPEFNGATATYRLKFMRGGRVVWIDVDARNGRVLQTSGD